MNEILALYHRPSVARDYESGEDFAGQICLAEDTESLDYDTVLTAARAFWRECRDEFPPEA